MDMGDRLDLNARNIPHVKILQFFLCSTWSRAELFDIIHYNESPDIKHKIASICWAWGSIEFSCWCFSRIFRLCPLKAIFGVLKGDVKVNLKALKSILNAKSRF